MRPDCGYESATASVRREPNYLVPVICYVPHEVGTIFGSYEVPQTRTCSR